MLGDICMFLCILFQITEIDDSHGQYTINFPIWELFILRILFKPNVLFYRIKIMGNFFTISF